MRLIENMNRPWMDHGDEEVDYEEWEPKYGIDNLVRSEFSTGGCGYLALALTEKTGWPVVAETSEDGDIEHIWCVNANGMAVDINGVHPEAFAQSKFNDPEWRPNKIMPHDMVGKRGKVIPISCETLDGFCHEQMTMDWAREIVELFPSHFGI